MTLPIKVADEVVGRAIPENLHAGIEMYINDGIPLGGFLEAVFSNDRFEAFAKADAFSAAAMPAIVAWIYNYAPSDCHGSPERVAAWLARNYKQIAANETDEDHCECGRSLRIK